MNRRTLLSAIALAPLAACATGTTPTASQIVTDAQTIANALSVTAPAFLALTTSAAVASAITGYIADVSKIAGTLSASMAATAMSSVVQQFIADVQALAPIVLGLAGLPPALVTTIQAAVALLPVLAAAAGLSLASDVAPAMSAADARSVLLRAAGK